ncbi:hypothetical protein THSYN_19040 [Candidatus Thiodictyon syntrophicum]|uniref:Uncharacterized protein n=1 Tax=Candidatus Thiodictyon syntrophicum TaxID=1166950 RepID=A0A2K8UBB5_9GAMM|nr:hypothetical protein THSYN_19040 [Candidatus Thiodictyon syntrophicum]
MGRVEAGQRVFDDDRGLAREQRHQTMHPLDRTDLGGQAGEPVRHRPLQGAELRVTVQHLERLDGAVTLERIGTLGQGLAAGLPVFVHGGRWPVVDGRQRRQGYPTVAGMTIKTRRPDRLENMRLASHSRDMILYSQLWLTRATP